MRMPSGDQLKAARIFAGLEQAQLASEAKINASTLSRIESSGAKTVRGHPATIQRVLDALAANGIEMGDDWIRLTAKPKRR
jgi:transcriptional regulator with XRE-family HTH domain